MMLADTSGLIALLDRADSRYRASILTLDRRHFRMFLPRGLTHLELLPQPRRLDEGLT